MAQQGGKGDDVELTLVMLVAIFFVLMWGMWSMMKEPIVEGIRQLRLAELAVIGIFDPSVNEDRVLLGNMKNDQTTIRRLKEEADLAKRTIPMETWIQGNMLAPEVLWTVSNRVGEYTRYPLVLFLLAAATFYTFFSKKTKFRTVYTLESLIKVQSKQWPVITPIVDFDPAKHNTRNPGDPVPDQLPIFAEALSPEEWVAFHRIPMVNKLPDRDAMRRAFQHQLGPRWTGLSCLTPPQRCLMAAFALKGAQRRRDGDALLGRVALAWHHTTDFVASAELNAEVDKVLKDEKLVSPMLRVAAQHAFRTTAILGVLKWARERGGVCAPAAFLWLRAHDRALWYPLNNLGRRTYHSEAAGVMAHYMAEKGAGKALPVPRLETAVLTMIQYWGNERFTPVVPPREETKGKKKG
jgi:intracellular multiplication protein IcmP